MPSISTATCPDHFGRVIDDRCDETDRFHDLFASPFGFPPEEKVHRDDPYPVVASAKQARPHDPVVFFTDVCTHRLVEVAELHFRMGFEVHEGA